MCFLRKIKVQRCTPGVGLQAACPADLLGPAVPGAEHHHHHYKHHHHQRHHNQRHDLHQHYPQAFLLFDQDCDAEAVGQAAVGRSLAEAEFRGMIVMTMTMALMMMMTSMIMSCMTMYDDGGY